MFISNLAKKNKNSYHQKNNTYKLKRNKQKNQNQKKLRTILSSSSTYNNNYFSILV